jgi:hypothetical protein
VNENMEWFSDMYLSNFEDLFGHTHNWFGACGKDTNIASFASPSYSYNK